jgi:hypothetical protein
VNGTKNLIMGFWARQPFRPLEKFIASLRNTAFAGDVCLCVEDVSAETVALLRDHGIIVVRTAASAQPRMTALASRYFGYLDFLLRHGHEYANVMLTEPGAVVVQSDPFATPLPADIVYTRERRRIGESQTDHDAVVQAYGESLAHNIRDCMVSSVSATIGTLPGMLRYLVAMTHELAGRATPVAGVIDQGVHNYVVHMRPLGNAWLDTTESIAATMHTIADTTVQIAEQGVLVDGRPVPVLSQWRENPKSLEYVRVAPRFQLDESMRSAWPSTKATDNPPPPAAREATSARNALIAFYQRQRDADWLRLFLGSLRCVSDTVSVHCVGDFDQHELTTLSRHGCTVHLRSRKMSRTST